MITEVTSSRQIPAYHQDQGGLDKQFSGPVSQYSVYMEKTGMETKFHVGSLLLFSVTDSQQLTALERSDALFT